MRKIAAIALLTFRSASRSRALAAAAAAIAALTLMLPLVINIDPAYHTVPLGLVVFQGQWTSNIPLIAAGAILVAYR